MRTAVLGFILALSAAGAAQAADYVVVSSSDPAIRPGQELTGGQRVALGAGQTLRFMDASGNIATLRGAAGGAVAPKAGAAVDPTRMAQLKVLIDPPPSTRTFGARRSGVCPDPAILTTLDQILEVQSGGCAPQARIALETYLAKH
jgi:hypothetical protein